jgi:hypothetical protein
MCEILDGLSKITFLSLQRALFNGFDSFSNIDSMRSCSQPPFFGDCQSRHQSEMAMNARHLTGAGTMFLDAFDACLCDFVGGTTWNLQHVRLLSTWIGIPGDQVKSFVFFQLNPAVLSPETSLGPVFFVLLWHVRLCKDILSFICILLFVGLKATYVFFSWLNYFLLASELNTLAMCGLVFVIGFLMFMLPIVPGTAVYLFSGVVAWFDWFEGH